MVGRSVLPDTVYERCGEGQERESEIHMDCEAIEQRINGLRIMPIGKEQQKKMKRLLICITVIAILAGIAE